MSLLFSHIDFIFNQDEKLLPTSCSYAGHEYNRERRIQDWTKTQLRGLIKELHSHGVKVFLSCFDISQFISDPAYLTYDKNGKLHRFVCVIKPLGNGTVGDVIIEKLRSAIDEYGFDGLQLADGLSSSRYSIENGDFSVSLCGISGISIPKKLMGEDVESYIARRSWILKNRRFEWIRFLSDSWADFYKKLFDGINKPIMFNNTWTLGPFEALYRYGVDYSRCQLDRAFSVMVEENSATRSITATEDEGNVEHPLSYRDRLPYKYSIMQQQIKLHTNGLKQISLMPISDTMEQWDALRHCPMELTKSIIRRYNNFVYIGGRFIPCSNAPLYCLADGISAEDWSWIAKQESYRIPPVDFADGFAGVYNPDALYTEVERFCKHRAYFGAALTEELVCSGLNLCAQLSLSDVPAFDRARCLVVTDLNAYTEEQKNILYQAKIPILAVGEDVELPLENSIRYNGKYISAALYNSDCAPNFEPLAALDRTIRAMPSDNGDIWTEPLAYRRVSRGFFEKLAEIMNSAFSLDQAPHDVKIAS